MSLRIKKYKILPLVMMIWGCGTQAGNPKKPGDDIVLPEIKYEIPSSVSGESSLMLAANTQASFGLSGDDDCSSLFHCKARRAHRIVEGINAVIRRIRDTDRVRAAGSFSEKGPARNLSGKLQVIDDGEFTRSATMCFQNKVFLHMKWSEDSRKIIVTRDFSADPLAVLSARNGKSRVEFTQTDSQTTLDFRTESEWESPPGQNTDGDILNEHMISKVDANKNISITAVNDWYDSTPSDFEGDHYLTGTMNASGQGEFVTYIKSGLCDVNGFDEDALDLWNPSFTPGQPRWCFGRKVESATLYNNSQLTEALSRLQPIGILSKETLGAVNFDTDVDCE